MRLKMGAGVAVALAVLAGGSRAGAVPQTTGLAVPAAKPTVETTIDGPTGATLTTTRSGGGVTIGLQAGPLAITKRVSPGKSITTILQGTEQVSLTIEASRLTVTAGPTPIVLDGRDPGAFGRVRTALAGSRSVAAARQVLDRLAVDPHTFGGQEWLLSRAVLGTLVGDPQPSRAYHQTLEALVRQPRLVKAGLAAGPEQCWDEYAAWAIKIWDQYTDCTSNLKWYDLVDGSACAAIYDLQAEMAMSWLWSCSGGIAWK